MMGANSPPTFFMFNHWIISILPLFPEKAEVLKLIFFSEVNQKQGKNKTTDILICWSLHYWDYDTKRLKTEGEQTAHS